METTKQSAYSDRLVRKVRGKDIKAVLYLVPVLVLIFKRTMARLKILKDNVQMGKEADTNIVLSV